MTQPQQEDVLQYFKGGKHKVLIATSVAEEGLDIRKCDLVLNYLHVSNMVGRIQTRGDIYSYTNISPALLCYKCVH